MALIKCGECGAEISDQAKACPKCGAPVPKAAKVKKPMGVFGWSIILLVVGVGLVMQYEKSQITPAEAEAKQAASARYGQRVKARDLCKESVIGALKAPGTAKMAPDAEFGFADRKDGGFDINGWVDSQNSLGGLLRSEFKCFITIAKNGDMAVIDQKIVTRK